MSLNSAVTSQFKAKLEAGALDSRNQGDMGDIYIPLTPEDLLPSWRGFFKAKGRKNRRYNAYHYMDYLFERLSKKEETSYEEARKLWLLAVKKYRYTGHRDPVFKHRWVKKEACELCGKQEFELQVVPSSLIRMGTMHIDICYQTKCHNIAMWDNRMGGEVELAKELGVTIKTKEFKGDDPVNLILGYVDFKARLVAAEVIE